MIRDETVATTSLTGLPVANGYAPVDNVDTQLDLGSDPSNLYIGYGVQGSATSSPVWTIKRIGLTGGNPAKIQWTAKGAAVWDNRATETYL